MNEYIIAFAIGMIWASYGLAVGDESIKKAKIDNWKVIIVFMILAVLFAPIIMLYRLGYRISKYI